MVRDTQASPQLLYIRFQEATQLHLYSWRIKAVRTHVTVENRGGGGIYGIKHQSR